MSNALIMIVDDEPKIVRIIQVNLERAGYRVRFAYDGNEALRMLVDEPEVPHMLLLDMTMPYMDGFELMERMQSEERLKNIPVVITTARVRDADIIEGQRRGATWYLTKPVSPTELLGVVKEVLGGIKQPPLDIGTGE